MITETDASDHSAREALRGYEFDGAYDEMFRTVDHPRKHYRQLYTHLLSLGSDELRRSKHEADQSFFNQGITFTVYGSEKGTERIFPHDLLPRIITAAEWETIERGLTQRITALNLFLKDVYHDGKILKMAWCPEPSFTLAKSALDINLCKPVFPEDLARRGTQTLRQRPLIPRKLNAFPPAI